MLVGRIVPQSPNWGLVVDPSSVDFVLLICFSVVFFMRINKACDL